MTWHVIRVRSKDAQKQLARMSLKRTSAFVGYDEFCGFQGGCYPPQPSTSVDNTILDLQNSSYPMKAELNNKLLYYPFKIFSRS